MANLCRGTACGVWVSSFSLPVVQRPSLRSFFKRLILPRHLVVKDFSPLPALFRPRPFPPVVFLLCSQDCRACWPLGVDPLQDARGARKFLHLIFDAYFQHFDFPWPSPLPTPLRRYCS